MARHKLTKSRRGPYHLLIGPYDEQVIAAIKSLPAGARSWDPKLLAWRVADERVEEAQGLLDAIERERAGSTTSTTPAPSRSTTPTRRSGRARSAGT